GFLMDSRRLEPGIREEMRAGTENTTGQNREDRIRGRGVRMETGSVFGKKISGRYMFGGYHSRSQLTRDCGGLEFWIINGDLAFWYMGSSIRNGLSEWKIMEQWVKTIQGRGDYGHTTVVWVVLLRGEQNGLRWFGLVNWCGRRKYEMLGIWSQVLVSLNHELDRMQIKYARYYVWCYARVSIWYLETADGSWYAGDTPNPKIHQVLGFWVILWAMENYSSSRKRQWKYGKKELIYIGQSSSSCQVPPHVWQTYFSWFTTVGMSLDAQSSLLKSRYV
ncbi:hypothetical protein HID58_085118, partial [Brassica napus]